MDLTRQASMIEANQLRRTYHVIGCGGIGSWIALALVKAGVAKVCLWDEDLVEESNLHRTPYRISHVGRRKSTALMEILLELMGEKTQVSIISLGHWRPGIPIALAPFEIVFCAVDGMGLRQQIYEQCKKSSSAYIDVGAEAEGGNVSDRPADWEIETTREGEYFTPIWIAPCMVTAALAVWLVLRKFASFQPSRIPVDLRFDERVMRNLLDAVHTAIPDGDSGERVGES